MTNAIRAIPLCLIVASGLSAGPNARAEEPTIRFERLVDDLGSDTRRPVITTIAVQPAGELLSASGDDHIVRIWDMRSGSLLHRIEGHQDWVRCSAFAPNGETLATCGDDGRILIWNAVTGKEEKLLFDHERPLYCLAFAPDGKTLVAVGFQKYVCLFDIPSLRLRDRLPAPSDDNRVAVFSSNGDSLAVAGRSGSIRIYDMHRPQSFRDFNAHRQRVRALAFMPHGPRLVSGGDDRSLIVWNVATGEKEFALATATQKIHALVCLSPYYVASGGSDNNIRIWDLTRQQEIHTASGHTGTVASMYAAGQTLFSTGFDTTIRQWTLALTK
jgi:WD40 repeat protein